MVPGVFKCITNGSSVFYFYPKWYIIKQNNMFRNQPDETIEAVNKKKIKMNLMKQNVHTPLSMPKTNNILPNCFITSHSFSFNV
jgi:hypothetical protein